MPVSTGHEDRGPGRCDSLGQIDRKLQSGTAPDDTAMGLAASLLLAQMGHLRNQARVAKGTVDPSLQLGEFEGFLHEVEGADAHGLDGVLDSSIGGHQQDSSPLLSLPGGAQDSQAPRSG